MVSFEEKPCHEKETMFIYSYLLESSHYTIWVFPLNMISQKQRRNMLMCYPWSHKNAPKGLCNVMIGVENSNLKPRKDKGFKRTILPWVLSFCSRLVVKKNLGSQPTTVALYSTCTMPITIKLVLPRRSNDFPHGCRAKRPTWVINIMRLWSSDPGGAKWEKQAAWADATKAITQCTYNFLYHVCCYSREKTTL